MSQTKKNKGISDSLRKKRLGQYFSGERLARALASLSHSESVSSIIDPMGGDGDMLAACLEQGSGIEACFSIEIDPLAHKSASERFKKLASSSTKCILGNCFEKRTIKKLPQKTYDLVITNPPYVRYQNLSRAHTGDISLPSALEIRSELLEIVNIFPHLDQRDKDYLRTLISSYSGLSDLAVPSWFLCAMFTRIGGTLAMVVPEAWISRDYAQIIKYLLFRWFHVRYVVEDAQAVWFPEALVKTTLLIAERIPRRDSAIDWTDEGYLHVRINGQAMNSQSIVGNIFPNSDKPEQELANLLLNISREKQDYSQPLLSAEWVSLKQAAKNLRQSTVRERWFHEVEELKPPHSPLTSKQSEAVLPPALERWLPHGSESNLISLNQLGVCISQGLRTGANQFFYVDLLKTSSKIVIVQPNPIFDIKRVEIPKDSVRPVLRRQSELGKGFSLNEASLKGRVLALQEYALAEDLENELKPFSGINKIYKTMPSQLSEFVKAVARKNVGTEGEPKLIPQMTAVRTNSKKAVSHGMMPPKFWYMLPQFSKRHYPDMFVARVNNMHPRVILNPSGRVLIDANFSTLWTEDGAKIEPHALLALLNSSWCIAAMELSASVMGGGALKLEATHIRRLPIPNLDIVQLKQLSELGNKLTFSDDDIATIREIDMLVVSTLVRSKDINEKYMQLVKIKEAQLKIRTKES